ncbi:MAG TPA: C13 family peptidase [Acetobacteraceae bacterium]|nr:C13 family peptidase [Acetobacteraceae bacterium]
MERITRCCFHAAVIGLTLASASLEGCAEPQTTQPAQQQQAANTLAKEGRLFYIGIGLYSESWSENDVVELADKLQSASRYQVVPMIASNVASAGRRYPIADDATIAALVGAAAAQAGPDDIVFVDISSHGGRQVLARKVGNNAPTALSSRELARKLEPLAGHRTVIVVSACYSGSLIGDLRAPERIIITAARADRSSFGCAPGNRHTLFGEAELHAFGQPDRSLHQVFTDIRDDVARMESKQRYQPSEPQVWVGADVADLYDAPGFQRGARQISAGARAQRTNRLQADARECRESVQRGRAGQSSPRHRRAATRHAASHCDRQAAACPPVRPATNRG